MKLHLEDFISRDSPSAQLGIKQLEMNLWVALAEAGVLFGPGQCIDLHRNYALTLHP